MMKMRKVILFPLFLIALHLVFFPKVYQLDELLRRHRIVMKYRKILSEQKIVTGFDVDSSLGLIPLEKIDGSAEMKVEFLDSLEVFFNMENLDNLDFGVSWGILKRGTNEKEKEFMRGTIEGEIEIVNLFFNYLETKVKLERLKKGLEGSERAWETSMPIDYGLLKIEMKNMKERLKTMCGLSPKEELEIITPDVNVFDLDVDLDKVLSAVYLLYSPPSFDVDLDLKAFLSKENDDMRFNLGFSFSWSDNPDFESSNWKYFAELEMNKVRKLYSQMEFLKKVLKDYENKKDENSTAIFKHYSLEIMRLYNQLKIMEEIVK